MRNNKIIALFLTLLLIITALAGCGANSPKSLAGTYKATADMSSYLNQGLQGAFHVEQLDVDFYMDLKGDGTYEFHNDEEQFKDSVASSISHALDGAVTEDQVKDMLENDPSMADLSFSESGNYKVNGDKIIFDEKSDKPLEASIGSDKSLTISLKEDFYTGDLTFVKQ